ncbi:3-hydroxyacyl-ACP dehydratase FabZ family protein [Tenacibaculum sp. MEBiC06402]|uniref:3-hydroxyacyl-ACP dehydratase FabZ family protein n=1 Tax=unclassified Tenacibaculum TaxID=2635139 RepID=UPI003B9B9FC9
MTEKEIIKLLPYQSPFLFVDQLTSISKEGITGSYTFKKDEFYYRGHFKDNPVTPGVILTEVMAQIGVVCLGIYLLKEENNKVEKLKIALTSHTVDFFIPVYPEEEVTVISEKEYFRFNKLKCKVKMLNTKGELICRGTIAGMMLK